MFHYCITTYCTVYGNGLGEKADCSTVTLFTPSLVIYLVDRDDKVCFVELFYDTYAKLTGPIHIKKQYNSNSYFDI